jgi:hypothetical protein
VNLRASLEVLAELAPRLAAAGVRGIVRVGEISFELEAAAPREDSAPAAEQARSPAVDELDPLEDPDTFGGGSVPRLNPRGEP